MSSKARVLIVRGHQATPWELAPWTQLPDRFTVELLLSDSNDFDIESLSFEMAKSRTLRGHLPLGPLAPFAARALGDRYYGVDEAFGRASIVHAEELSYWFSAEAAKRKRTNKFKLVQTVWETLPMLDAFRNRKAREFRDLVLRETDLFLPTTERARDGLLLEGVPEEKIEICPPGIDIERFAKATDDREAVKEHVIISPGRLVWEKGHQDVIRALAALRRGVVALPDGISVPELKIIGKGPERERLLAHAAELGVGDLVEIDTVSYSEMPSTFASASCMVLASLSSATFEIRPGGVPHAFWEEQFGYVIVEAMAAGLPLLLSSSGAIPQVGGPEATYFTPGDWITIAKALVAGPLTAPVAERKKYSQELQQYSMSAMAARLTEVYDRLVA